LRPFFNVQPRGFPCPVCVGGSTRAGLDLDLGALAEGLFTDLAFDRGDRVQSKLNKDVKGVVERWNDETTLVRG